MDMFLVMMLAIKKQIIVRHNQYKLVHNVKLIDFYKTIFAILRYKTAKLKLWPIAICVKLDYICMIMLVIRKQKIVHNK